MWKGAGFGDTRIEMDEETETMWRGEVLGEANEGGEGGEKYVWAAGVSGTLIVGLGVVLAIAVGGRKRGTRRYSYERV